MTIMKFPDAIDASLVGQYPALVKSGGGYFFDHVLEYRVWCHPERGALDEYEGDDYYHAFASYDEAKAFSEATSGAEEPLALVRQLEWINEPEDGRFVHERGERITEWRVEWLEDGPRSAGAIESFLRACPSAESDYSQ